MVSILTDFGVNSKVKGIEVGTGESQVLCENHKARVLATVYLVGFKVLQGRLCPATEKLPQYCKTILPRGIQKKRCYRATS
jgi:hypothetical protein